MISDFFPIFLFFFVYIAKNLVRSQIDESLGILSVTLFSFEYVFVILVEMCLECFISFVSNEYKTYGEFFSLFVWLVFNFDALFGGNGCRVRHSVAYIGVIIASAQVLNVILGVFRCPCNSVQ